MHFQRKRSFIKAKGFFTFTSQFQNKVKMISIFKIVAFAANISAHVLTLGSAKDQALFDNYLSPMQVRTENMFSETSANACIRYIRVYVG